MRSEDPVTTDLIGALLVSLGRKDLVYYFIAFLPFECSYSQGNVQNMSSRRSSNDSTVIRTAHRHGIKHKVRHLYNKGLMTTLNLLKRRKSSTNYNNVPIQNI